MFRRAFAAWLIILLLANLNGALRELWLIPRVGEMPGRVASTLILSGLVLLLSWLMIGWVRPARPGDALGVGLFWLALTLAFEFIVGHYVLGKSWAVLLEDYDVARGRIWILVLVMVVVAPLLAARLRGLFQHY
jgi:hypothetical protein